MPRSEANGEPALRPPGAAWAVCGVIAVLGDIGIMRAARLWEPVAGLTFLSSLGRGCIRCVGVAKFALRGASFLDGHDVGTK